MPDLTATSSRPNAPSPPETPTPEASRDAQEVLWEQMLVRYSPTPGSLKELTPDQRISREGFRPLISRNSSHSSGSTMSGVDGEAVLDAAERYHQELKAESAHAEEMLEHLDELEQHLHSLHASNDTSEELSILISYVRLEKSLIKGKDPMESPTDPDLQGTPVFTSTANVDITKNRPLAKIERAPHDRDQEDEEEGKPSGGDTPDKVTGIPHRK